MNHPQSFLGGPTYHPAPTQPEADHRPAYAPRALACLTVRRDGRVYLNAEAVRLLPAAVAAVELLHPVRARDRWRLDTRPGGRCALSVVAGAGRRCFRAPLACRELFAAQPAPVDALHFVLRPAAPSGLYWLELPTVTK